MLMLDGSRYLGEGVGRYVDGVLDVGEHRARFLGTWQCLSSGKAYWMDDGDW